MKFNIIPGILTNNIDELKELISQVDVVNDRVHIDIIDGIFADNLTIDPSALVGLETSLKIDYHLMVKNPSGWLAKCANSLGDRVFGHVEMMQDQTSFLKQTLNYNLEAGLALDMKSRVDKLDGEALALLDAIVVMGVDAGFGGQTFKSEALSKIEEIHAKKEDGGFNFEIIVDGGVNSENVSDIIEKGADSVIVGNRIFKGNIEENVDSLLRDL